MFPQKRKKHFVNFWKNKLKTFHHILEVDSSLVAIFNYETILYIKATVFVCLCGQCLEDSSSHCPLSVVTNKAGQGRAARAAAAGGRARCHFY
jgi:hypothetical protein